MDRDFSLPVGFSLFALENSFTEVLGDVYMNSGLQMLAFRPGSSHANLWGVCHGGVIATFADLQLYAITGARDPDMAPAPTISLTIDYFVPVEIGSWVEAKVTLAKRTGSLVFTQSMMSVNQTVVARSQATYKWRGDTPTMSIPS